MPSYKTTLWIKDRGATFFRLMNTITEVSQFRDVSSKNMHLPERQWEVAVDQMNGWRNNGGKRTSRFKIVQTDVHAPSSSPAYRQETFGYQSGD
jgi:hypothetical protein